MKVDDEGFLRVLHVEAGVNDAHVSLIAARVEVAVREKGGKRRVQLRSEEEGGRRNEPSVRGKGEACKALSVRADD
jgi:hypothetical protein